MLHEWFGTSADWGPSLADGLGWEQFSLVGHSMGGKAVQRCSLRPRGG
ncbi:hypothetical protein ABZ837_02990 [Streptomyces sp. NPDC047197]